MSVEKQPPEMHKLYHMVFLSETILQDGQRVTNHGRLDYQVPMNTPLNEDALNQAYSAMQKSVREAHPTAHSVECFLLSCTFLGKV